MTEPKSIKVTNWIYPALEGVPKDEAVDCIIQNRKEGDKSKIVYIINPNYIKGSKDDIKISAPYIALTDGDYEVVEYTTEE